MTGSPVTQKTVVREAALARRDGLYPGTRDQRSAEVARRCAGVLSTLRFDCLAGYWPIRSECDPRPVMAKAASDGVLVALPSFLDRQTMVFRRYSVGDVLVPAGFGTSEPAVGAPIVDPDLLLVPLAAFDRSGARLGYGKGHYDRTIAAMRARGLAPLLCGLAFSVQAVDRIPVEPHDVRLDLVVTEDETIDFRGATDGTGHATPLPR